MTIQELEAVAAFCTEYAQYLEKGMLGRVPSLRQQRNHEVKNVLLRLQGAFQVPGVTLQDVNRDIADELEAADAQIAETHMAIASEWEAFHQLPQPQFRVPPTDLAQESVALDELQATIAELRKTNKALGVHIEALRGNATQLRKTNAELFAKLQHNLNNPPAREVVQQYEEARASWHAQRLLLQDECAGLRDDNTKLRAALGVLARTPFGQEHEIDCECGICQQGVTDAKE